MFRANTCLSSGGQFINTASGIVTLCKWPFDMQVEQELLDLHTGRPLTLTHTLQNKSKQPQNVEM